MSLLRYWTIALLSLRFFEVCSRRLQSLFHSSSCNDVECVEREALAGFLFHIAQPVARLATLSPTTVSSHPRRDRRQSGFKNHVTLRAGENSKLPSITDILNSLPANFSTPLEPRMVNATLKALIKNWQNASEDLQTQLHRLPSSTAVSRAQSIMKEWLEELHWSSRSALCLIRSNSKPRYREKQSHQNNTIDVSDPTQQVLAVASVSKEAHGDDTGRLARVAELQKLGRRAWRCEDDGLVFAPVIKVTKLVSRPVAESETMEQMEMELLLRLGDYAANQGQLLMIEYEGKLPTRYEKAGFARINCPGYPVVLISRDTNITSEFELGRFMGDSMILWQSKTKRLSELFRKV